MRLRHLFAFVLSVTLIQTHGQNNTSAKDYFYQTLMKGEVGQAQSQRISVSKLRLNVMNFGKPGKQPIDSTIKSHCLTS